MSTKRITATAVTEMRRRAKRIAREGLMTYSAALETEAQAAGYGSWHDVTVLRDQNQVPSPIIDFPIDPKLPAHFYFKSNGERSRAELKQWWNKPFACTMGDGSLDVQCLDGGAHDRPTFYGRASDLAAAKALAANKLAKWLLWEKTPIAYLDGDEFAWALMPHHPKKTLVVLAVFKRDEREKANLWREEWLKAKGIKLDE